MRWTRLVQWAFPSYIIISSVLSYGKKRGSIVRGLSSSQEMGWFQGLFQRYWQPPVTFPCKPWNKSGIESSKQQPRGSFTSYPFQATLGSSSHKSTSHKDVRKGKRGGTAAATTSFSFLESYILQTILFPFQGAWCWALTATQPQVYVRECFW